MFLKKAMAVVSMALLAGAGCSNNKAIEKQSAKPKPEVPGYPQIKPLAEDDEVAVISTEYGQIIIRFYPEVAPEHVANFIDLAKSKFYDGTTFHRVIPGFMIQGGDPNSRDGDLSNDGTGNGPRTLKAEFSRIPHTPGIVSMARGQNPNSASSQFFIMVNDYPSLNGQYSVFGKVVEGMDVADKIVNLPRDENDNPGKPGAIDSITIHKAGEVLKFPLN